MTKHVVAFAGTRADVSPLAPVLVALARRNDVTLTVCCALGLSATVASDLLASEGLLSDQYRLVPLRATPCGDSAHDLTRAGADLAREVSAFAAANPVDVLLVLGDRWELLWVVPTFVLTGVPVVHLHGGEVTEGAVDERVRHAVTKLADVHCVATPQAYQRVVSLGEDPEFVHLTGAPGLDRIAHAQPFTAEEFEATFGRTLRHPLAMFTYHPATGAEEPPGATAAAALDALSARGGLTVITDPGLDVGREEILAEIHARRDNPHFLHVPSLGARYPRLLKTVDCVVGNSSSGIIEAPFAGAAVLDIGERQKGRDRADRVVWCAADPVAIHVGLDRTLAGMRDDNGLSLVYGQGDAAHHISSIVAATGPARPKPFRHGER